MSFKYFSSSLVLMLDFLPSICWLQMHYFCGPLSLSGLFFSISNTILIIATAKFYTSSIFLVLIPLSLSAVLVEVDMSYLQIKKSHYYYPYAQIERIIRLKWHTAWTLLLLKTTMPSHKLGIGKHLKPRENKH